MSTSFPRSAGYDFLEINSSMFKKTSCCYHSTFAQVALKLIFSKYMPQNNPSPLAQVLLEVQKQMTSLDSEVKETRKATEELQQARDLKMGGM